MNKDQALGIVRELGTALGVALVTFGVTTSSTVELVLGVLLSVISLFFALKTNEGSDIVLSLFRKVLSGVSGGLVAWGYLDPAKAEALAGVVLVIASSAWTFSAKSDGPPGGGMNLLWIVPILALCLCPSCASTTVRTYDPVTGKLISETTTSSVDGAAFTAGANAVTAIAAPRAVLAEK